MLLSAVKYGYRRPFDLVAAGAIWVQRRFMNMDKTKNSFETFSGIPLKNVYTPEDTADIVFNRDLGDPGSYPYTRGAYPNMYRGKTWIVRSLCGENSPRETNKRLSLLTSAGQTAIDLIGDPPTQHYMDSDHPLAAAVAGSSGVPLCCLQDFLETFDGISIGKTSCSFSLPAATAMAGFVCAAREHGVPPSELRGSTVQPHLMGEECGYKVHMPVETRVRLARDAVTYGIKHMPKFHSFMEGAYFFREGGLTTVEEMALALIEIRLLVGEVLNNGLDIDEIAPRIVLLVGVDMDFFEEIAKIRAIRRIWAKMMREEYGAKDPRSWRLTITARTSGMSLTAKAPINNVTRAAYEALAATLAGCQALEISCFDEPIRIPSPEAAVAALRTQQILAYETGITNVADPLGGSYFVEKLTNEMETNIMNKVREIESHGNPCELSKKGYFTNIFRNASRRYEEAIRTGRRKVVKVNTLCDPSEEDSLLKAEMETKVAVGQEQIEKIKEMKAKRNKTKVEEVLNAVYQVAQNRSENLLPAFIEAFQKGLTAGEISGAVRVSYGLPFDHFNLQETPFQEQQK